MKLIVLSIIETISGWVVSTSLLIIGVLSYLFMHPDVFEKWASIFFKVLKTIWHSLDKTHVKFDVQSKINKYVRQVKAKTKHLSIDGVKIKWIDSENITPENYIKDGNLIVRLHKSENPNQNLVNATVAFISEGFLKKAKSYLAKYQRDSLDQYFGNLNIKYLT